MTDITTTQLRVLNAIAKEAGVMAWEWGWVLNPIAPRKEWEWRFDQCRHAPDLLRGGVFELLGNMRAENCRGHDICFRPRQGKDEDSIIAYRYFVLDDVPVALARQIAAQNRALVVKTSNEGGCQVWVFCRELLTRRDRLRVQQHYQKKIGSDIGAVSGIQFSRMPGFKNFKRGGQWVNVLCWPIGNRVSLPHSISPLVKPSVEPSLKASLACATDGVRTPVPMGRIGEALGSSALRDGGAKPPFSVPASDKSLLAALKSAIAKHEPVGDRNVADWRACNELLRGGADPEQLTYALSILAVRKGRHAGSYAERTVSKLMAKA